MGRTARLRSGLSFLQPGYGEWYRLLECAVRMDYFQNGIEVHEGDTVIDVGATTVSQVSMEVHNVPGRSVDSIPQMLAALGFAVVATSPLTAFRRTGARPTA